MTRLVSGAMSPDDQTPEAAERAEAVADYNRRSYLHALGCYEPRLSNPGGAHIAGGRRTLPDGTTVELTYADLIGPPRHPDDPGPLNPHSREALGPIGRPDR